ncbi:8-amino-7-oxononanoate synthase domain protein, partial [Campylobacter jejuni subsp. jejuni 305]
KLQEKNHIVLGDAYIICLLLGENKKALEISQKLQKAGFFCSCDQRTYRAKKYSQNSFFFARRT